MLDHHSGKVAVGTANNFDGRPTSVRGSELSRSARTLPNRFKVFERIAPDRVEQNIIVPVKLSVSCSSGFTQQGCSNLFDSEAQPMSMITTSRRSTQGGTSIDGALWHRSASPTKFVQLQTDVQPVPLSGSTASCATPRSYTSGAATPTCGAPHYGIVNSSVSTMATQISSRPRSLSPWVGSTVGNPLASTKSSTGHIPILHSLNGGSSNIMSSTQVTPRGSMNVTPRGSMNVTPRGSMNVTPRGSMNVTPRGSMNVAPGGRCPSARENLKRLGTAENLSNVERRHTMSGPTLLPTPSSFEQQSIGNGSTNSKHAFNDAWSELNDVEAKMIARISRVHDDATIWFQEAEERLHSTLDKRVAEVNKNIAQLLRSDEPESSSQLEQNLQRKISELEIQFQNTTSMCQAAVTTCEDAQGKLGMCIEENVKLLVEKETSEKIGQLLKERMEEQHTLRFQQDKEIESLKHKGSSHEAQVQELQNETSLLATKIVGIEEMVHEMTRTRARNTSELQNCAVALKIRLEKVEETLQTTMSRIASDIANQQANTIAELCEEVSSLAIRMPTIERLSRQAAEIPEIIDALEQAQRDIATHIKDVKAITEETPRKNDTTECTTMVCSIMEELKSLATRTAKTETAVSFARSELDALRGVFQLLSQRGDFSHRPSAEVQAMQLTDGNYIFGVTPHSASH